MLTLRCLLALKGVLEMHVWQSSMTYRNSKHGTLHQRSVSCEEEAKAAVVEERRLIQTVMAQARPWRLTVDGTRAVLDLLVVGVGYLL